MRSLLRRLNRLELRLLLGFAVVLAIVLGGVSVSTRIAAGNEAERFQRETEEVRAANLRLLAERERQLRGLAEMERFVKEAGLMFGWSVYVTDGAANKNLVIVRLSGGDQPRVFPLLGDTEAAAAALNAVPRPTPPPAVFASEPRAARVANAINASLLWVGVAAGVAGIAIVAFVSRRTMAPLRSLESAAQRLGAGDLSQRVPVRGTDEVARLGHTFNAMAQELERAETQRRNLVADVAHELRTPIANIQGYLEAVRDGLLPPDEATIASLLGQTANLGRLVQDLALVAQAEAGALRIDPQPAPLAPVLRRALDAFAARAEAKGVALSADLPQDLPPAPIDAARVGQAAAALLENALTHTPQGGSVVVAARAGVDSIAVSVADTGAGVPAADLPYVFDRFYRADPSRSRATGGVGLGLTIAKQLIEAHGGTITAESQEGAGSVFTLTLPIARAAEE
ncbi:MAG: HAMP domain-containing histidine kinase [Dehalococcoidia bacterium]|nr:HAMP domain-containing histidine kinase [Dehalococcoidia bacterium]